MGWRGREVGWEVWFYIARAMTCAGCCDGLRRRARLGLRPRVCQRCGFGYGHDPELLRHRLHAVLGATHGARHWWAGLALAGAAAEATRLAASRIRTMEVLPGMYSDVFRQGYQRGLADAHCEVLLANARGWRAR